MLGKLPALTRDSPDYWDHQPDGHNAAGLFVYGPQEARPSWPYEVKTGSANTAPATETREAALGRERAEKRRRLARMALGTTGQFTGRNRRRGFVTAW